MSAKRPTMADVTDLANDVLGLVALVAQSAFSEQRPELRARALNCQKNALVTVRQELHEASRGRRSWPLAVLETEAASLRELLGVKS